MYVVVPFAAEEPKTRLEPALDPRERETFARAMLEDVLEAVRGTGREPTVLATGEVDVDAPVLVDERPLSTAVNDVLTSRAEPVAVVMADLALATPETLEALFSAKADVALVPGRGGGTNAVLTSHPEFRVDYHGGSYLDHRRVAREIGADLETVDSFRLSTDIDEPADLVEVALHGGDRSRRFLEEAGFSLEADGGRVSLERDPK